MTDDHTRALCDTYGITTTFIRRQAHWLAEAGRASATAPTEAAAVAALVARLRPSHTTRTPNT
jgi:hypothetical protein